MKKQPDNVWREARRKALRQLASMTDEEDAEITAGALRDPDNPRSEEPAAIRAAILKEAPGATEIGDRNEAICAAIAGLRRGDVLLIAGKGHESGQIIGNQTLPFSDHAAVAAALRGTLS